MSEYQYLEFLAVDRPLTEREMDHLRAVSSRAQITPVSFVNEYNWGGLKANPRDFMRHFFDAHLFVANWGDAIFMLRLSREAIDRKTLKAFCSSPHLEFEKLPEHWLLTWSLGETEVYDRFDYVEGPGWMTRLAPLREELLRGDLRSLYIGWLRAVTTEETDPDELEPLALDGLDQLTAAQQALAEFLEVDIDLLAGAGGDSSAKQKNAEDDAALDLWLDELPRAEVRGYLRQMLAGQGMAAERALKRRHAAWKARFSPEPERGRRSVAELWQLAEQAKQVRLIEEDKARREAEAERKKRRDARLANMAQDFPRAWKMAHEEACKGHAHAYDAACRQLVDLRDAYKQYAAPAAFQKEFQKFMAEHQRRRALVKRLVEAGLRRVG
ncbi:hypothetical protein C2E25_10070 [Geothermobacter hydrogeniphilus]|uniref:Uncharacterized protein n=1 Tax=Geothermobacter hydrogeniphilus TaxID=1969733 RepID=A0A2K2H9A8_9BACT|nr:hypothetical protein [Geothermobacter hydrogeniphilus]PNU19886.1 hypothetical protein C2E25_10070 [Geothermobacter hydrogeniphilus]